jgi:peptide/nickel transport system substrate-binding protein
VRRSLQGLAVAAGLLLASCGGGDAPAAGGGGGTVIVGMRSDFSPINPVTNSSYYTTQIINYALFTPLIQYDANLKPEPYLAESWELHGDTGVTFHLRSDVQWHDGQPVTAHDVKFTFDLAKNAETASLLGTAFLSEVASGEVVDDRTIRFRFARPHAQALEDFWWPPLPRHLLEDVAPIELANAPFNRQPVGSGPFRFAEWRANERLVLERNPAFPAGLGGPAAAERLVFRIVPEASTLLTELFTGGVHVDIPVLPEQVEQIESNGSTKFLSFPGTTVYFIGWNNEKPPFDDARVRLAMAHAVDRQEIIGALLHGQGEIATSTIPPWHPAYPADVQPLGFDRARAGQLLDEAGWTDRNGDGVRENAAGQPLAFTLMSSDDALRRAVVEVLQNQLRQVGARVDVRVMEFQTMLAAHKERNYDAVFTNWVLDNFQVAGSPFSLFHSSQADVPLSTNRSGTRIPELDRLLEQGARATTEAAQRAAWRDFTVLLQREQPVTFMFWLAELAGVRNDVQGVEMDPRGELRTMARWSIAR